MQSESSPDSSRSRSSDNGASDFFCCPAISTMSAIIVDRTVMTASCGAEDRVSNSSPPFKAGLRLHQPRRVCLPVFTTKNC